MLEVRRKLGQAVWIGDDICVVVRAICVIPEIKSKCVELDIWTKSSDVTSRLVAPRTRVAIEEGIAVSILKIYGRNAVKIAIAAPRQFLILRAELRR